MSSPESVEENKGVTPSPRARKEDQDQDDPNMISNHNQAQELEVGESRIDPDMENIRSKWTFSQLFHKKRNNPAWRHLTRIMRLTSDQLDVSSIGAENYDKAVTRIMEHFAALRDLIEDGATRDKVGKTMIYNYGRRMHYRQSVGTATSSLNVKEVMGVKTMKTMKKEKVNMRQRLREILDGDIPETLGAPGEDPSSWTVQQLLERKKIGNPAWLALASAMRETSDEYRVTSAKSENYDKALTETLEKFEALKPLVADTGLRKHLGTIMVTNVQSRHRKKELYRLREFKSRRLMSPTSRSKNATSRMSRIIAVKKAKKAPAGKLKKSEKHPEEGTVVDENANETGGPEVPVSNRMTESLYPLLSDEARDLVFRHKPAPAWQRLRRMMRLSSDALGLVGLRQEKAYHAIKQILRAFPPLQPYMDDVKVQKKFRHRMYRTLQRRINHERQRLAEFCLTMEDPAETAPGKKQIWKQTSLMSTMKKITDVSTMGGSSSSSDEEFAPSPPRKVPRKTSPMKATPKKTTLTKATPSKGLPGEEVTNKGVWQADPGLGCKGSPHKGWTRQEIMSVDISPQHRYAPPRLHFLRVMQDISTKLNVAYKSDQNYELAITQTMNHFAALKRLVNVRKYRGIIGTRMVKNRQLRDWKRRSQRAVEEKNTLATREEERSLSEITTKNGEGQAHQKKITLNTKLAATEDPQEAVKSRKRKREPSLSELKESLTSMRTVSAQPRKTIQGYLQVRKSKMTSAGEALEERGEPDNRSAKRLAQAGDDIQEDMEQSELDAEDLDTSGESRCSERSGQSKTGSRKSIEYYMVVRKKAEGASDGSGKGEKGSAMDGEQMDVGDDLKDGCAIYPEDGDIDDDDDAFEDPPKAVSRHKKDGGSKDLKGTGDAESEKAGRAIKKRESIKHGRKKSGFMVNVKSLCSKELNTSDELQDQMMDGEDEEVKIFSDWTLTGDSEASEGVGEDINGVVRNADKERLEGEKNAKHEERTGKDDDADCQEGEEERLKDVMEEGKENIGTISQKPEDESFDGNGSASVSEQTEEVQNISTSSEEGMGAYETAEEGGNDDPLEVVGVAGDNVEHVHVHEKQVDGNQGNIRGSGVREVELQDDMSLTTVNNKLRVAVDGNEQQIVEDGPDSQREAVRIPVDRGEEEDSGHKEDEEVFLVADDSTDDLPEFTLHPVGDEPAPLGEAVTPIEETIAPRGGMLSPHGETLNDSGMRSKVGEITSEQRKDKGIQENRTSEEVSGNVKGAKKKKGEIPPVQTIFEVLMKISFHDEE